MLKKLINWMTVLFKKDNKFYIEKEEIKTSDDLIMELTVELRKRGISFNIIAATPSNIKNKFKYKSYTGLSSRKLAYSMHEALLRDAIRVYDYYESKKEKK